jgi:putative oxygen-independent coproporphyrinogen III oxidase
MANKQPEGESAPIDGALPLDRIADLHSKPFSIYLHVPYCASRCGYCDFNTYTFSELGENHSLKWLDGVKQEIALAKQVLVNPPKLSTIFVGGGTPTLLEAEDLVAAIAELQKVFSFESNIEITTEANPDSVDLEKLKALRDGGFNRISFGMQSAVPSVLKVLERTHNPENVAKAVSMARAAGFDQINLDLIYGTPGETIADLQTSIDAVLALDVDHVSAYALIVEEGTRLAKSISKQEIAQPDDDDMADKYLMLDKAFSNQGFNWYEVSNWAKPNSECQHNIHYWMSSNWWGIGPGAHSHVNGVRWWNEKLPRVWSQRLANKESPANAREILNSETQNVEEIMLKLRLAVGMPMSKLNAEITDQQIKAGLATIQNENLVLSLQGRLLADRVIDSLTD